MAHQTADPVQYPPWRQDEFPVCVKAHGGQFRQDAPSLGPLLECGTACRNLVRHAQGCIWIIAGDKLGDGVQIVLCNSGKLHRV